MISIQGLESMLHGVADTDMRVTEYLHGHNSVNIIRLCYDHCVFNIYYLYCCLFSPSL